MFTKLATVPVDSTKLVLSTAFASSLQAALWGSKRLGVNSISCKVGKVPWWTDGRMDGQLKTCNNDTILNITNRPYINGSFHVGYSFSKMVAFTATFCTLYIQCNGAYFWSTYSCWPPDIQPSTCGNASCSWATSRYVCCIFYDYRNG